MNNESARNASRLRMNACVCSHALQGQFAHTVLAREKKVGYFLNRPRKFRSWQIQPLHTHLSSILTRKKTSVAADTLFLSQNLYFKI